MKDILQKCTIEDFEYISEVLENYASITNDSKRKQLLAELHSDPSKKEELVALIDEQIRYFGSSDAAYFGRKLLGKDGGISAAELVSDVCEKSKVKVKLGGSLEARLEQLVNAVVEKELKSKSPEELVKAFKAMPEITEKERNLLLEHIKTNGEVLIIPILVELLGPKLALGIIEAITVTIISKFVGQQAAKLLVKEAIKRNPWLNALGPVMWAVSATWLAFDVQGPAFRKTIPICLYLGMVGLRDGQEVIAPPEVA
jgi:uncharacterized protein YaaW (UPF0174 family)